MSLYLTTLLAFNPWQRGSLNTLVRSPQKCARMSTNGYGTKWRINTVENSNWLSRVHERYTLWQTTTDRFVTAYRIPTLGYNKFQESWLFQDPRRIFPGPCHSVVSYRCLNIATNNSYGVWRELYTPPPRSGTEPQLQKHFLAICSLENVPDGNNYGNFRLQNHVYFEAKNCNLHRCLANSRTFQVMEIS